MLKEGTVVRILTSFIISRVATVIPASNMADPERGPGYVLPLPMRGPMVYRADELVEQA